MKNPTHRMDDSPAGSQPSDSLEAGPPPPHQAQLGASTQFELVSPADPSASISIRSSATVFAPHEPAPIEATLVQAVLGRWRWLLAGGAALAIAAFAFALRVTDSSGNAWVQLVRNDLPVTGDAFKLRHLSTLTLADMLRNPAHLQRVGAQVRPPVSPEELARSVKVKTERDGDILTFTVAGASREAALELANVFARTAVEFTRELQAGDVTDEQNRLKQHLERIETDLAVLNQELRALPPAPLRQMERYKSLSNNLETARAELANLKPLFNEEERRKKQSEKVAALEKQQQVISQLKEMEDSRLQLNAHLRAAKSLGENLPGYYRLLGPATSGDGRFENPRVKVAAFTMVGGVLGVLGTAGLILLVELFDDRLKTSADVARISQLPFLMALGDIQRFKPSDRTTWSLRAWTALQRRLTAMPSGARVCGIISTHPGEGRSTWISLLSQAASQCGFRVLSVTIDSHAGDFEEAVKAGDHDQSVAPVNGSSLAASFQVTDRLFGPDPQTVVQISLPRWVWTFERRMQWQEALLHWSQIPNLVILVELPPASVSESLLLAETVPNLFWLVDAGQTTATELREHLRAFRHAGCHLAGVGLNHEPPPPRQNRFFPTASATAA